MDYLTSADHEILGLIKIIFGGDAEVAIRLSTQFSFGDVGSICLIFNTDI